MNRKTRRQTQRRAKKEAVAQLSEQEMQFRVLGTIYDRALNARTLAEKALTILPEDDDRRTFYEDAITDLEGVMLETTKALLEPVLERLRAEPQQTEAPQIVVP